MNEEKTQQKKLRNYAFAEGYLRECTLERGTTKSGTPCLKGEVVIATSRFNSQRIRVFAFKENRDGKIDKKYESLETLLSPNVTSIASYLATLTEAPSIDQLDQGLWEAATKAATKVWTSGSLEEYLTIGLDEHGNEHETSSFSFRGTNGGVKKEDAKRPFNPRVTADLDGRVLGITPEIKRVEGSEEPQETGRQIIQLLYIDFKGVGHKFKIYASDENITPELGTYADYVKDNYEVGQTAKFTVAVMNLVELRTIEPKQKGWGVSGGPITTTRFTHELRLIGGRTATGISEGEPDFVTDDEAKVAMSSRLIAGKENGEQRGRKGGVKPGQTKGFGVTSDAPQSPDVIGESNFPSFDTDF